MKASVIASASRTISVISVASNRSIMVALRSATGRRSITSLRMFASTKALYALVYHPVRFISSR